MNFGIGTSRSLEFYQSKSVIQVFEIYPLFEL